MDITIEAVSMTADAGILTAVVSAVKTLVTKALVLVAQVASFARLSIGGTSLSAVAPDHIFEGGTALGAA